MSTTDTEILDVAVVGGGAAGAYAAFRLLEAKGLASSAVALFERSERIGGRLWSYHFGENESTLADLGGMAFTKVQQNVFGLAVQKLGLPFDSFPPYSKANLQFLRQERFLHDQYNDHQNVPYPLPSRFWGLPPAVILQKIFEERIPGLKERVQGIERLLQRCRLSEASIAMADLTRFLQTATIDGEADRELWRCSAWSFLLDSTSTEVYSLLEQTAFYVSTYRGHNLYDIVLGFFNVLFSFFYPVGCSPVACGPEVARITNIFGELKNAPPAYALKGGFDQLPKTLLQKFEAAGGQVYFRYELIAVDTEEDAQGTVCLLRFRDLADGQERTILGRKVILALPKQPIERLSPDSVLFRSSSFRRDLAAITRVGLSKIFLTFEEPWWRAPLTSDSPFLEGFSNSDLPLNTPYYITGEGTSPALIIASLTSEERIPYWKAFRSKRLSGLDPDLQVTPELLEEARSQLEELHGYDVPRPTGGLFVDWGEEPYGAGRHNWRPGYCSWELMPRLRQPLDDVPIYLCGEAFSAWHGWVEGAFNTAERVLEDHFELSRPDWMLPEYDLGP